jgi:RimJ/RimL family protein N-acetyltransferase
MSNGIRLRPISASALEALAGGQRPDDVTVADDYLIGYAIVGSCWGRGYAREAVRAIVEHARGYGGVVRVVANTPLDRPASARVLEKAGFALVAEEDDEDDGVPMRVRRWEL